MVHTNTEIQYHMFDFYHGNFRNQFALVVYRFTYVGIDHFGSGEDNPRVTTRDDTSKIFNWSATSPKHFSDY